MTGNEWRGRQCASTAREREGEWECVEGEWEWRGETGASTAREGEGEWE